MSGKTKLHIMVLRSSQSKTNNYHLMLSSLIKSLTTIRRPDITSAVGFIDKKESFTVPDTAIHLILMIYLEMTNDNDVNSIRQMILDLSEKYTIKKVKIYSKNPTLCINDVINNNETLIEICDANLHGPGYFTLSMFSCFPELKKSSRLLRDETNNGSFYRIIECCDKMSTKKEDFDQWMEKYLHFHKELSLDNSFDKMFAQPYIYDCNNVNYKTMFDKILAIIDHDKKQEETAILVTKFLNLVEEMKEKNIELPDDFQLYYLITKHQDRCGSVIHIFPFLNRSEAEKEQMIKNDNMGESEKGKYWHREENMIVDSDTMVYLDSYDTNNIKKCEADCLV